MSSNMMDANYQKVIDAIKSHGKSNPSFPNYGQLNKLVTFGGLAAALKTMKRQKIIDFSATGIFKDNDVVTLISDYEAAAVPTQITYEEIGTKIKGETTSHQKTNYESQQN
ncbi:hypothetical protein PROFUN_14481 [Planoprotostelium fungivorum]|uniref:Costars domain-containing protein n=1 Tax=Planoprotostelium fungivorum TaxID=1890364 RepID=A0A2P6MZY3_9EUKA|nr:hypothetical protein PROFUN_14481 [Planoprotostelium fungivorum]